MQTTCDACGGSGESIPRQHRCGECNGAKTVKQRKRYEVNVHPGMEHGQQLVMRGQADEAPEMKPGDLILVLQCKAHERFVREVRGCRWARVWVGASDGSARPPVVLSRGRRARTC